MWPLLKPTAVADVKKGATTTRVTDFVNRGAELIIQEPFRLSAVVARTLNPGTVPMKLHVDYPSDTRGWPMVGFIFMVDEFRPENGATCFLPGSQEMSEAPSGGFEGTVPACGPAGSMIIYNGSVWHEHGPNTTGAGRRSIQGAFIRRTEKPALDWQSRMRAETVARLSPLAKYLLDLQ